MSTNQTGPMSTRRRFLVAGGASALGAVTLGACAGSNVVNTSGTVPTTLVAATAPPTTADKATLEAARSALRTAASLERSLAAFYTRFGAAAYLDETARTWGTQFAGHHEANATALDAVVDEAGGEPYTQPNEYADTELIEPAMQLADATESSDRLIELAAQLESTGAATCALAVGSLADAGQRQGIMAVGATNARQASLWRLLVGGSGPADALGDALYSLRDALPAAASVDQVQTD